MTKKQLPTAIIFTHRGQELDGLVLADKGICWQVELSDGTTLLVQKKHVITELLGDSFDEEVYVAQQEAATLVDPDSTETADPFEDEVPAADSLTAMLTKIRAEGKVAGKKAKPAPAKPAPQAKTPKPTAQAKTPTAGSLIGLKELCAKLGVEPRIARRRLRNSQGQVGTGSRWEWEANSKELQFIECVITAAK